MGFGEKTMTCNIHPEISKRSCLKHIGDALSVVGMKNRVWYKRTFPESLSTGHCWIVQNDTFTALGTEIRETGTALLNLPMLPSYDKDSASLPAPQRPSGLTSVVCKSGIYIEDTTISGRLNEPPHGDSKLDSCVMQFKALLIYSLSNLFMPLFKT